MESPDHQFEIAARWNIRSAWLNIALVICIIPYAIYCASLEPGHGWKWPSAFLIAIFVLLGPAKIFLRFAQGIRIRRLSAVKTSIVIVSLQLFMFATFLVISIAGIPILARMGWRVKWVIELIGYLLAGSCMTTTLTFHLVHLLRARRSIGDQNLTGQRGFEPVMPSQPATRLPNNPGSGDGPAESTP